MYNQWRTWSVMVMVKWFELILCIIMVSAMVMFFVQEKMSIDGQPYLRHFKRLYLLCEFVTGEVMFALKKI